MEIELVEVIRYEGSVEKRFRFRVKGTSIYFNIPAPNVEEAARKVREVIRVMQLERVIEHILSRKSGARSGEQEA